jgi:hypothetical protein
MWELLTSFLGKIAGTVVPAAFYMWVARFRRPKISVPLLPQDIFEHIGPACSRERVKEILGSPHEEHHESWLYRFRDALVQVEFYGSAGVSSVALALTHYGLKKGYPLPWIDVPLGKLTFGHFLLKFEGRLSKRSCMTSTEVIFHGLLNRYSRWRSFTVGAINAPALGLLPDSEMDVEQLSTYLRNSAVRVRIGWVGLSGGSDEMSFAWSIALPNAA